MIDLVGWLASALFISSYLVRPGFLRRMQVLGALTWTGYGVLLHSAPLIVANTLFVMAVAHAVWRERSGMLDRKSVAP